MNTTQISFLDIFWLFAIFFSNFSEMVKTQEIWFSVQNTQNADFLGLHEASKWCKTRFWACLGTLNYCTLPKYHSCEVLKKVWFFSNFSTTTKIDLHSQYCSKRAMVNVGIIWKVWKKNRNTFKLGRNNIWGVCGHLKCRNTLGSVLFITYGPHEHAKNHEHRGKTFYSFKIYVIDLKCVEKKSACRETGFNLLFRNVWECASTSQTHVYALTLRNGFRTWHLGVKSVIFPHFVT